MLNLNHTKKNATKTLAIKARIDERTQNDGPPELTAISIPSHHKSPTSRRRLRKQFVFIVVVVAARPAILPSILASARALGARLGPFNPPPDNGATSSFIGDSAQEAGAAGPLLLLWMLLAPFVMG